MKVLLIEDDRATAQSIASTLQSHYTVEIAYTGRDGEYKAQISEYGIILLDYMLPDIDGIKLCKSLRSDGVTVPILMLTGAGELKTKVAALHSGADDYVVKPIHEDELRARIQAITRRSTPAAKENFLQIGELFLDLDKLVAVRSGVELNLKRKELDILQYLMRNAGRVITRAMIFDHVWESSFESDTNVVDVHIKYLRDQVDRHFDRKYIKTAHGYGYKLDK